MRALRGEYGPLAAKRARLAKTLRRSPDEKAFAAEATGLPQRFVENAALKKTLQKDSTKKLR